MAVRRVLLQGNTVALSDRQVDALIRRGSGDAALLYLYLLRHEGYFDAAEALRALSGWDQLRLDGAMAHLRELGLADSGVSEPSPEPAIPDPSGEAPDYSAEDIAAELRAEHSAFPELLREYERAMGRKLSSAEVRTLLELYDHLALPPEVLLMLLTWQIVEYERKYGPGRRPRMSLIRTAAYRWKRDGVDTVEAVDAYLKKQDYYRSREGALLAAVGIRGRAATAGERKYLEQWAHWELTPELAAQAADRTVTNTGAFKWPYCHAILKRWQAQGIHTPEEATALDKPAAFSATQRRPTAPAPGPVSQVSSEEQDRRVAENARWMQEFLQHEKGNSQ